jgi:hypothetical protein
MRRPWWWAWCRCGHHEDTHLPDCRGMAGMEDCPCLAFRRDWLGWLRWVIRYG